MPRLREIIEVLDQLYDPRRAHEWDAVGLVCGDPQARVERVLLAVDPVTEVVEEAVEWGAQLILTHHPLFLRGVHSVAATTPKGRLVHRLLTQGIALHVCHTNADAAYPGVSDALARLLGVQDTVPLAPEADAPERGIGRIGHLAEAVPARDFAHWVAAVLPPTAHGVRIAGDLDRMVERVAVSGGAGDSYLDVARDAGVDAYVTADLRHHPASEAGEHQAAPVLVDVAHWASEWPWLVEAETRLASALADRETTVETRVSKLRTDPWSLHLEAAEGGSTN